MKTSSINIKVDEKLKENALEVLNCLGLSLTDAIRIYLRQIVLNNGIPFDIKIHNYNSETIAAMEEDDGIFLCPVVVYPKDKIAKIAKIIKESKSDIAKQNAFDNVEDLFADIDIDT